MQVVVEGSDCRLSYVSAVRINTQGFTSTYLVAEPGEGHARTDRTKSCALVQDYWEIRIALYVTSKPATTRY